MPLMLSPSLARLFVFAGLAVAVFAQDRASAQIQNGNLWPTPKLNTIFPPGGKVGSMVEVGFTGTDVEQPDSLWFSHPGIKGTPIIPPAPTPDPKKPADKKDPPPISKITVTIDKAVPPGLYDVRLVNSKGMSNPRIFVVGELNEVLEKEPNNDVEQAQKIEVGSVINGTIAAATDVDFFQIPAKKGQRILFHAASASLDGKMNPELRIFDTQNRQIAYARALPYEDTLLDFVAPADGEFLIRLNHFTYTAGAPEYVYRMTVWAGPWIDAVFPPIVEPGKPAQVQVFGRNLPGGQPDPKAVHDGKILEKLTVTINPPADASKFDVLGMLTPWQGTLNGFEYRLGTSNPVFIAYAQAPVVLENDDNDTVEKAQTITLPCEIAGRVDKKRDRDWFVFDAKKGDVLIFDAASQRLGAPTDLYFKLMNVAKKQEIVLQDDTADSINPRGYYTVGRDPQPYRFAVPEDGKYHLLVGSHSADIVAGPAHVYRVRITPEKPDFQLVVMPPEDYRADSCILGRGGVQFYNVFPIRQDGYKGEIALTIEGLPAGVTCPPQILSGGSKSAMLAIVAADNAPEKFDGVVKVIGTAIVGGQKVVREARPASVTWGAPTPQNSTPTVTRHNRSLVLSIRNKAPLKVTPTKDKIIVLVGDKADVPLKLTRIDPEFKGNFQIAPNPGDLPTGLGFAALTFAPGKDDQTLALTTQATTVPGNYNVVLRGFGPIAPPNSKGKNVNTIIATAPFTVTVVPKQVATLTVDNPNPPLKAGGEAVLTLKFARLFDFAEAFKVQLMPENANGVSAQELTIGPGQNEAKITLKAPETAAAGQRSNLTIRAIAVVHGLTLNHDLKFNVNVTAEPKKK